MKKYFAFIVTVLFLLLLCACGSEEKPQAEVQEAMPEPIEKNSQELDLYHKYSTVIDALESGDYADAIAQIESMMPAPPEPEIQEVVITTDNFFDYYEFVEMQPSDWTYSYDAYGKISSIEPYVGLFTIQLKPEYELSDNMDSMVTIGYTLRYVTFDLVDVDFDAGTYTIQKNEADKRTVEILCDSELESRSVEGNTAFWVGSTGYAMSGSGNSTTTGGLFSIERDKHYDYFKFVLPTDFQLIRCEGRLFLKG